MTKGRILLIAGAVVLAAGAGGWYWLKRKPAEAAWRTAKAERGSIQVSVTSAGTLQAVVTVMVGTQVSGTIAALHADFNSQVKKGQVIARLDTTLLQAALADARSSHSRMAAQERQASEELKRAKALFERSLISKAELDQATAAAQVASANLSSAGAQVERARINLRYATITSPIDGIVLSRAVDVGQTVAASFNTPTLFTIAGDLREMQVKAAVDEADIGKIRVGQKAAFTVDAYPDTTFTGEVEQVRIEPKVDQNVVTYDVVLRAPNPDLKLMPGMTASLTIAVARKEDVLLVPAAALRFRPPRDGGEAGGGGEHRGRREAAAAGHGSAPPPGDGAADSARAQRRGPRGGGERGDRGGRVFVLAGKELKPVRVKTGLSDGTRTEIEGGLEPGTDVVVGQEAGKGAPQGARPFGMSQPAGGRRRF